MSWSTCYVCGRDMRRCLGCDTEAVMGDREVFTEEDEKYVDKLMADAKARMAANDLKITYFGIGIAVAVVIAALAGFNH